MDRHSVHGRRWFPSQCQSLAGLEPCCTVALVPHDMGVELGAKPLLPLGELLVGLAAHFLG